MRSSFPGHFRPTLQEFDSLWADGLVAVDANVLLNLYRYSQATRQELEKALTSVRDRLLIPHQAAKEFLRNRLGVTAGQAEEYTKAVKAIKDLSELLQNKKKHPFLPDEELPKFSTLAADLCDQLETQRATLLDRLVSDEILDFVEKTFSGKIGEPLDEELLKKLGRPLLQAFYGALAGQKAKKGVFITTSSYTPQAIEFARSVEGIVLIDGQRLAGLMIDYELGVTARTVKIPKIDGDYFDEEVA